MPVEKAKIDVQDVTGLDDQAPTGPDEASGSESSILS
jgi:hypothetical protein